MISGVFFISRNLINCFEGNAAGNVGAPFQLHAHADTNQQHEAKGPCVQADGWRCIILHGYAGWGTGNTLAIGQQAAAVQPVLTRFDHCSSQPLSVAHNLNYIRKRMNELHC
ncbi:hypothetical protein V4C85_00050 [Ralstonia solanacearum]|uniref:hypothetical protein n=1 Tax=Ralstonia solanacearum TaxID=305 RepID=UPI000A9D58C9|nr:hypothetical protein [Ralstonia solanacearum]MDB0507209.1 hypothetical protein [Ralstonia solanacearum]MDB0513143.1 hypothetical protein [Ralstonia solanacearum]MDB0525392.1 hypothetical protein [Ralstonia solanacearum]QNT25330.1 hypothetical protein C2I38_25040 [Ralstonia solanacearum]QNT62976.1 hypothetical protein C2L97_25080 [Ralstonia solanacearum]